ncbi:MAG TPA: tyrosine-type recombinase/integrase [Armatimonadota bacterium]|jgi:site-specific recombinase XerD
MHFTQLLACQQAGTIDREALAAFGEDWARENQRKLSNKTAKNRRVILDRLLWFLDDKGLTRCGVDELDAFLDYLRYGHTDPRGRWGNPRWTKPVRPQTELTYYSCLRALFYDLVEESYLTESPFKSPRLKPPDNVQDEIEPFKEDEVRDQLRAAGETRHASRDRAILLLLYDTGIRASELCDLTLKYVDFTHGEINVLGKGNKRRSVPISDDTAHALWNYLYEDSNRKPSLRQLRRGGLDPAAIPHPRKNDEAVFRSDRGVGAGDALTPNGLLQLVERIGRAASVTKRCSPHSWRHTFAVTFLRNGGNVFSLQKMLGHTSLVVTRRYVALAEADIARQHEMYSPVAALNGKGRR